MPVYQLLNLQGFENLEGLNIIKLPTNLKKFFFPQELEDPFSNIFCLASESPAPGIGDFRIAGIKLTGIGIRFTRYLKKSFFDSCLYFSYTLRSCRTSKVRNKPQSVERL
jgi:hypothetical protein